mmetsp:Transcript_18673/g.22369  ORF Transcript_18673/g.22369 Transcript_18673/m.22369 type:complete len:147 (+) Transcript_18673:105-545(+)|eukprot:CAMPEP_0197851446 /NCGR_PEP_ID=MMETSP1438-20131217/18113_1 /TAXON_ID=1461541 /ORGANISM="Pterosperma sp., Strain CCMP1384" /LENGTH=146 /DNA_ID=CAMNT_0043465049 /DNA_START=105 /DNA_END=545 /DNA_ORIENTATION=-
MAAIAFAPALSLNKGSVKVNTARTSFSQSASSSFTGVALRTTAPVTLKTLDRQAVVETKAFFGPFAKKTDGPMICIDCGYIYNGDFNALPRDYKCPKCNVGKNRFKAYKAPGSDYASLSSQKKAYRAAKKKEKAQKNRGGGFFGRK